MFTEVNGEHGSVQGWDDYSGEGGPLTWIQLRHVYKAFVFSKLLYASPAWWGFTSAARPTSNVSRQHYDVLSGSI